MAENYKIMIVDDEEEVREGIAKKVNWAELGFEIVATAENGEDALEKAEGQDLDVVLTDIKMPFMDGLTLSERLRALYPNIRLIIFTGFDEFEYAKKAIGLNVVEYILKPVNGAELSDILRRVKNALDEDIASKRSIENMRESYEKLLPLLRERFLNELLGGLIPRGEIEQQMQEYKLPFVKGRQKNVIVFDVDARAPGSIAPELVPVSVKRVVDAHCAGRCVCESFISSKKIVVVTEWTARNPIAEIMALAGEVCDECRRVLELRVTAGVGSCCETATRLAESYNDAVAASEYKAVAGASVIYIRDMELAGNETASFDPRLEKLLTSAIKFGSREQIREALDEILAPAAREDISELSVQTYLIGVLGLVLRLVKRAGISEGEALGEDGGRFLRLASDIDRDELRRWLETVCVRLGRSMSEKRVSTEEKLVADAKEYIAEQYANSRLSVDVMCEYLHISQSYFSTLFKKVTGQTYVNYLTELRLKKAVELLDSTEEKTYLIANSVGYEEPNYFSYVFKKRYGLSPSQYRAGRQSAARTE